MVTIFFSNQIIKFILIKNIPINNSIPKPKFFHEPISWKKCMMVGRGRLAASPRGKIDSLEKKRKRLIVMTIEIISFIAHFINNTV